MTAGQGAAKRTLADWLAHAERQHSRPIELGLERVAAVRDRLGHRPAPMIVTVGGTNGKGSTCAMLERILGSAGYRVGLYSSPHLLDYNERVRIGGEDAGDAALCTAFEAVERARGDTPLTYFEFGTLMAAEVFAASRLDVAILEVGLGGRLDAVNAFEPDCAAVVSVGIDHTDYLGPTREDIGWEKAGIFRPDRPAVVGDADPPQRLLDHGAAIGAQLRLIGRDFGYLVSGPQWQYWSRRDTAIGRRSGLALPALRGAHQLANASVALAVLDAIATRLPVSMQDVRRGLAEVTLPGRFQVLPGRPTVVLDVAHNPHAAAVLGDSLGSQGFHPCTWAVVGMLADKDADGVVSALRDRIDRWLVADLPGPRGAGADRLAAALARQGVTEGVERFADPAVAFGSAAGRAGENDRILAFGSFLTVAEVMRAIRHSR